jgi:hypothetical protein
MGCFSFICTECGKPINSDLFSGENVRLSLLRNGKVIEEMQGQYDSYGRVFGLEKDPKDRSLTPATSIDWKKDWSDVCNLMFDDDPKSGISAVHVKCIKDGYKPTKVSEDDPNQGWGGYDRRHTTDKVETYHKVYDV